MTVHQHDTTSWAELLSREQLPRSSRVRVGDDAAAPLIIRAEFPPGYTVGPHTHDNDYVEVILEGSQCVTRRWYHPGHIRRVKAGTVYGPLVAGPDGATVLIVFRNGDATMHPARPGQGVWSQYDGRPRHWVVPPDGA